MKYAKMIATGGYLPEKSLTNVQLESMVDTSDEWIVERTGIKHRHIADDYESTASMATLAAKKALIDAHIDSNDIDLIIVATCSPDNMFPATACLVQSALRIERNIPAFDISAACSGFIYALSVANSMIRNGEINHALVIGSEVMSRVIDWQDRKTCVLFGDGAGAVVLSASHEPGIYSTHLHAQGQYKDILYLPNNLAAAEPDSHQTPYIHMQGHDVFRFAVKSLGDVVLEALASHDIQKSDIDWLVPHQANLRIIKATAKKLHMSLEQVILTVAEHGNTSAASIPLALDTGVRDGRIKPGHLVLMEAIGGGMTWGAALVKM